MPVDQEARPLFAVCSRAILIAICLLCAYVLVSQISDWRHGFSTLRALTQVLVLTALLVGSAYLAIRGRSSTVKRIVCEIAALAVVLVAVEVATVAWTPNPKDARALRERAAARLGLPFDTRDVSEVVRDLRSTGVDALPGLGFDWARLPEVRAHLPADFYPLSHASNAVVVACNESGRYFTYSTDEAGFNNPPGLLAAGGIDVALVGESYVLGFCLPAAQSFAARIRERYPRTANFAQAGNRTVGQLGSFREFVEPIRPRVVLWAINPTFVGEKDSLRDPVLARYLDPAFSQNLRVQQPEIDRLVRELAIPVQAELDSRAQATQRETRLMRYRQAWQLPETRSHLERVLGAAREGADGPDLTEFLHTLELVKRTTERWDGKLIVVLLPIYSEVVADQVQGNLRHDRLARVVGNLGIPVVDGVDLFRQSPDPAAYFTLRINNHPTAEAYALLAGRVLKEIDAQFSAPTIAER
jgi:hypothetical protein